MTRPSACGTRSIWRAASLLISQHGGTAVSEATRLAGRMLDRGDSEGWQVLCVDQPWRSRRYRRRARGNRIEMKRVSHPYGRSVPVTTISTGSAAAPGAHKPGVPIRDRRPGAVALGHFRGIGLDLVPAIEAPDDQPQSCCRGIAEGHSYFVLPKSGVIRPRIASPSGVSRQYPPSNLAQLHRRHFAAPYLPRNQPDTALRAYRRRHDR